jgi:hypothetical protein
MVTSYSLHQPCDRSIKYEALEERERETERKIVHMNKMNFKKYFVRYKNVFSTALNTLRSDSFIKT